MHKLKTVTWVTRRRLLLVTRSGIAKRAAKASKIGTNRGSGPPKSITASAAPPTMLTIVKRNDVRHLGRVCFGEPAEGPDLGAWSCLSVRLARFPLAIKGWLIRTKDATPY